MFENLSGEQIEEIEKMIKSAYKEGWQAGNLCCREVGATFADHWYDSLAKNESCHVVAEKFMKAVE